jgi:hypothetical protein
LSTQILYPTFLILQRFLQRLLSLDRIVMTTFPVRNIAIQRIVFSA